MNKESLSKPLSGSQLGNIPKVSVIVPVYNVEKYLRSCVESIFAQTFTDFELLLVDDGSPDGSGAICDEYAGKDDRVRVFHKENGGQSSARNLALDNCKGEYIFFIDSDDYISLDTFEVNLRKAEQAGCDIVQFQVVRIEEGREIIEKEQKYDEILDSKEQFMYSWIILNKLRSFVCGKCIKRSSWGDLRFPEGQIYEDRFLLPDILSNCSRIMFSNQGIYYYVQHSGQTLKRKVDYFFDSSFLRANIHALQCIELTCRKMDAVYSVHFWNTLEMYDRLLAMDKIKATAEFNEEIQCLENKLPSVLRIALSGAAIGIRVRLIMLKLSKVFGRVIC